METTGTYIDELPVSTLPDRYGVARSQVYNRIGALGLKPHKRGNKAFVNADQITQLDQIHERIQQGMTVEQAAAAMGSPQNGQGMTVVRQSHETGQDLSAMLLPLLAALQQPAVEPRPLERFEQLQALADNDWRPSTSELAAILGVKTLSGRVLERYGFRFSRVGRNGAQSAWKVERV